MIDMDTNQPDNTTPTDLRPGMRFQSTAPDFEHVVCTFMGAYPKAMECQIKAGLWRFVGMDRGTYPRAAYHGIQPV